MSPARPACIRGLRVVRRRPANRPDGQRISCWACSFANRILRLGQRAQDQAHYGAIVAKINALEPDFEAMSDDELQAMTPAFRERLAKGETLDDLLPEAFAVVREAAKRTLGQRHFDVQLVGGMVLHDGNIAEMKTGEGKTLVATLPVYLNALAGEGVHVVTVNDYLAKRDSEWMGQIYRFLGLTVGCIVHGLTDEERRAAYAADVTYGTNPGKLGRAAGHAGRSPPVGADRARPRAGRSRRAALQSLRLAASSTNRQSAFTMRICSIVRQRISSSLRARDEHGERLRARDRDVEAVAREEELEVARQVVAARGRHREEDDRRLLPLELVDRADPRVRPEPGAQAAHLRVVRRHDEHVVPAEPALARRRGR